MSQILQGDCIEEMKKLPDNSVDSVVTDPPYGLGFMGKEWDKYDPTVNKGSFKIRTGTHPQGYVAINKPAFQEFNFQWAKEVLRVLKPGGYLLSFGGTRTYHRMACAIEDAGFEVRDMIAWVYGQGFPKSLNIGKAVDKLQGNKREKYLTPIAKSDSDCWGIPNNNSTGEVKNPSSYNVKTENIAVQGGMRKHTKGNSAWEGWGTALKPAHEPICMARKPISEKTVAENVLKYGTGGINVDESRVGTEEITVNRHSGYNSNSLVESTKGKWKGEREQVIGRFPANLIHDGSEEVRECFPNTKGSSGKFNKEDYSDNENGATNFNRGDFVGRNDSRSASRFFK